VLLRYWTVTVIVTAAGFVANPAGLAAGVAVTMYVRALDVDAFLVAPPHAIKEPANGIASAKSIKATVRLRCKVSGKPSNNAQKTAVALMPRGTDGRRFAACVLAESVKVEVPVLPGVKVTGVAVAVKLAAVPSVELTLVTKEIVPAKLLEVSVSVAVPLPPAVRETVGVLAVSV
jgi:hypothetical protein